MLKQKRTWQRKRRGGKARRYRKKRSSPYTRVYRSETAGIPERYFCKLKICDNFQVGTGSNPSALEHYRLNSIYDPYYGTGGHQPRGFDQLASIYENYRVHKAKVIFNANYIDESSQLWIGLLAEDINLPGFSWIYDACEKPGTVWFKQTNRDRAHFLKKTYDMAKLFGMTKEQYRTDPATAAAVNADPAKVGYVGLAAANLDETTNIGVDEVNYNITIIYFVEFFNRKMLGSS